jgi:hypothetical protein
MCVRLNGRNYSSDVDRGSMMRMRTTQELSSHELVLVNPSLLFAEITILIFGRYPSSRYMPACQVAHDMPTLLSQPMSYPSRRWKSSLSRLYSRHSKIDLAPCSTYNGFYVHLRTGPSPGWLARGKLDPPCSLLQYRTS